MNTRTPRDARLRDAALSDARLSCDAAGKVGLFFVLAPAWYVLSEAVSASAFTGYNYAKFYISDLGVSSFGSFDGRELASGLPQVMNAGFIGSGLLFGIGLVSLLPNLRKRRAAALLAAFGVLHWFGITFVGLVPGSPENVENGRIIIHGMGAVAAILGGNLAAIVSARALAGLGLGRRVRRLGVVLGTLGLASGLILTLHWFLPDGVWERGAVYAFMLWEFVLGCVLLRHAYGHKTTPRSTR